MKTANLIGKRMKQARRAMNMQQIDLSASLSVDYTVKLSRSSISEIENGKRGVRDFELHAIAAVLEISPNWLLGWDQ